MTLSRLIQSEKLIRLKNGIYTLPQNIKDIDLIANQIYFPSYLSFESALSKWGLISQIPFTLTFATTKKTKKFLLGNYQIEYRMLKKNLFFGYIKLENNLLIATPEKALFDLIYLASLGKMHINLDSINLNQINKHKLNQMLKKFNIKFKL
ncbi:MAG: hypothetical protein ABDI07_08830 [Candidatus Kryptonium sp.]